MQTVPAETDWRPMADRSPIHAELDRVGASFRKAGASGYISVQLGID